MEYFLFIPVDWPLIGDLNHKYACKEVIQIKQFKISVILFRPSTCQHLLAIKNKCFGIYDVFSLRIQIELIQLRLHETTAWPVYEAN